MGIIAYVGAIGQREVVFRAQRIAWRVISLLVGSVLRSFSSLLVLLFGGMVVLFASLPFRLSSRVLAVLFPFSFFGPLSQGSIRSLAGFST